MYVCMCIHVYIYIYIYTCACVCVCGHGTLMVAPHNPALRSGDQSKILANEQQLQFFIFYVWGEGVTILNIEF